MEFYIHIFHIFPYFEIYVHISILHPYFGILSIFFIHIPALWSHFVQNFTILAFLAFGMPPKKSKAAWLRDWIRRIDGNSVYSCDGRIIFCEACQQQVFVSYGLNNGRPLHQAPSDQFYQLNQHNQTAKHVKNAQLLKEKRNRLKQQFFPATSTNVSDQFTFELCIAMISANIPFNKIDNQNFRKFLEKNCGKSLPTRQTLDNYLMNCFEQKMDKVRSDLAGCFYWISVDETTDKAGRFIANLLVGKLDGQKFCLILSGQNTQCDVPANLIPFYKFAPLTSVDVERSFSIYKSTLADNRMRFSPKNLEMYLICNFNQH